MLGAFRLGRRSRIRTEACEAAVSALAVGIVVEDARGRIRFLNALARTMLGAPPGRARAAAEAGFVGGLAAGIRDAVRGAIGRRPGAGVPAERLAEGFAEPRVFLAWKAGKGRLAGLVPAGHRFALRSGRAVEVSLCRRRGRRDQGWIWVVRGVSGPRAEEDRFGRALQARHAILDTLTGGVLSLDAWGGVLEINRAAEALFGLDRREALGMELSRLIPRLRLPDGPLRSMDRALADGTGDLLGRWVEATGLRADGSEFPVEVALNRLAAPGAPVFVACLRALWGRKS